MAYCFSTLSPKGFKETLETVKGRLAEAGFGILSEIDVTAKFKEKLGVDFREYRILGACNPSYAYQALSAEPYIGTMLPCNVIVQQWEDGRVEVSAIDPVASMQAIENPHLKDTALIIRSKLEDVIAAI